MNARRVFLTFAVAWLSAWLSACGSSGDPPHEPVVYTDVTLTLFRPFATGEYVFRSASELGAALQAAPFRTFPIGLVSTEPAVPAWDFQATMVVGISLGQGAWCSAPRLRQVQSNGIDLIVDYDVMASGTLACQLLAPRIGFALVPKVPGRVEFRRRDL